MIFAREVSDPLTSLVKKIDAENQKQGKKMMSFVIFLSDKEGMKDQLKDLATKEKLKETVLALESPAGPAGYDIPKEADVTVVFYATRDIKANHAFKKGEFDAKAVDRVLEDMPKIFKK